MLVHKRILVSTRFPKLIFVTDMATRVPAPEELCAGELERKLRDLCEHVELKKEEVRSNFQQFHCLLAMRETFLLEEMDDIVRTAIQEIKEKKETLRELNTAREGLERDLTKNKLKEILDKNLRQLEDEIGRELARGVNVEWIELEWKREQLEQSVVEVCGVVSLNERPVAVLPVDYSQKMCPVWSGVRQGTGQNELYGPLDLVTDKDSGQVFVYDTANRIQVFDTNGNYQRSIEVGFVDAVSIAITPHQLFVLCIGLANSNLAELDKLSGNIVNNVTLNYPISSITADTDTLYGGTRFTNQILHLSLDDMSTIRITSLNSPHIDQDTKLRDLKVTASLFVVLFNSSEIQTFSREGNLVRIIASRGQLLRTYCLCLDRHFNIIVSDTFAHNVKVFSPEGYLFSLIVYNNEDIVKNCWKLLLTSSFFSSTCSHKSLSFRSNSPAHNSSGAGTRVAISVTNISLGKRVETRIRL